MSKWTVFVQMFIHLAALKPYTCLQNMPNSGCLNSIQEWWHNALCASGPFKQASSFSRRYILGISFSKKGCSNKKCSQMTLQHCLNSGQQKTF